VVGKIMIILRWGKDRQRRGEDLSRGWPGGCERLASEEA